MAADAIVVGAGPNGLVAANRLAERGWDVLVLEAQDLPGGGVRSAPLIDPRIEHDLCSAFYPLSAAPSAPIAQLGLDAYGLAWTHAPLVLAHPARDGSCPFVSREVDETVKVLEELHPGDGEGWRELYDRWTQVAHPLLEAILGPFPPVRAAATLAWRQRRDLADLARFLVLPVRRMGEEQLQSAGARRLVAGAALHADLAPETNLSGFYGWLLCMLGHDAGFPVPVGGAQRITEALLRRLADHGGSLRCGTPVERVLVRDGRALGVRLAGGEELRAGMVLADVDAPQLYAGLVGAEHLPAAFLDKVRRFQWDRPTIKVDWVLSGDIPWEAEDARRAGTVHVVDDVDGLSRSDGQLVRGLLPDEPFLIVGQPEAADPTRSPLGFTSPWAYTHLPHRPRGDAAGQIEIPWTRSSAERFADRMERRIEALAPGFRSRIQGRHIADPGWFEQHDANLRVGAIGGGTAQLHQQLVFRPVPGSGRPTTPVRGLFLASASAHPGGGVHGAPGANAARAAVWHARLRRR